ncbi:MAG: hypothetical protein IJU54_00100 [Alphaproteobacteria bacterium]|nr:hypothetical protein [Alphaproteobacteria bacterium]
MKFHSILTVLAVSTIVCSSLYAAQDTVNTQLDSNTSTNMVLSATQDTPGASVNNETQDYSIFQANTNIQHKPLFENNVDTESIFSNNINNDNTSSDDTITKLNSLKSKNVINDDIIDILIKLKRENSNMKERLKQIINDNDSVKLKCKKLNQIKDENDILKLKCEKIKKQYKKIILQNNRIMNWFNERGIFKKRSKPKIKFDDMNQGIFVSSDNKHLFGDLNLSNNNQNSIFTGSLFGNNNKNEEKTNELTSFSVSAGIFKDVKTSVNNSLFGNNKLLNNDIKDTENEIKSFANIFNDTKDNIKNENQLFNNNQFIIHTKLFGDVTMPTNKSLFDGNKLENNGNNDKINNTENKNCNAITDSFSKININNNLCGDNTPNIDNKTNTTPGLFDDLIGIDTTNTLFSNIKILNNSTKNNTGENMTQGNSENNKEQNTLTPQ